MIPTSIEPAFLELMPSTVTINSVSSTNEYGIRTFGSSTTVSCRIQKSSRLVITEDGKQVPEEGRVYCPSCALQRCLPQEADETSEIKIKFIE